MKLQNSSSECVSNIWVSVSTGTFKISRLQVYIYLKKLRMYYISLNNHRLVYNCDILTGYLSPPPPVLFDTVTICEIYFNLKNKINVVFFRLRTILLQIRVYNYGIFFPYQRTPTR